MGKKRALVTARGPKRKEVEELPSFEVAARIPHTHEACNGRGCKTCDGFGRWTIFMGKDVSLPSKPKEREPVSEHLQRERRLEGLALRPCMS